MIDAKILILGFGAVGQSLFRLILEKNLFSIDNILIADRTRKTFGLFEAKGGKKENSFLYEMDSTCYKEMLEKLQEGDYFMNLAESNDDLVLATECSERGIHFLCTTDDTFGDLPFGEPFRYRTHFNQYKELMHVSAGRATSVIQFGSNPGLISVITKKALMEIVEHDENDFVADNRERLREFIRREEFALLAKELGVTALIETDLDTTVSEYVEKENIAYSTWNVHDFVAEMNDRSIQKLGSEVPLSEHLERIGVSPDKIYYYNKQDGTLVLDLPGKKIETTGYCKDKPFTGCVDAHEEVFSIHDYYTLRDENGEVEYAPSVMFVYHPAQISLNSVYHEHNERVRLIKKDKMISGGEIIGICVEGTKFDPIYAGTELYYEGTDFETPTVLLVSASVYAALLYMDAHPDRGVLLPEYLDANEIISGISPWLPFVSNKI